MPESVSSFSSFAVIKIIKLREWTSLNPFPADRAKSKIDKFSKITNWVKMREKQHHSKALLNRFRMNGHSLGFCP